MYSMCTGSCTAETIRIVPDPFWFDSNVYVKTSDPEESGKFWYKHKTAGDVNNKTLHVYRILMTDATTPVDDCVGAIEFYDGRVVRLSNVKVNPSDLPADSAKFSTDSGLTCPVPTCTMYTDIVFVLDYSGSVDSNEWKQQANFVISVMNSFTFGDNAAAAAVIQFNAPTCGHQPTWTYFKDCLQYKNGKVDNTVYKNGYRTDSDWTYDELCTSSGWGGRPSWTDRTCCYSDENTTARTAEVLAGAPDGKGHLTVSTTKSDLISTMEQPRTPTGGTCQAFGLELAMKVFDRSPRKNYAHKPNRIVIAVTDGADYCPNKTRAAAAKLRGPDYDALFLGIGVGFDCMYDKNFVENLTSTVGDKRAYYDVTDYGAIKKVAEEIFSPLCDEFHSPCRPDCNGFCGCGDCFCPSCDSTGSKCDDYRCTAGGGASNGCLMTEIDECPEDDKCTQYTCDDASGDCTPVKTCAQVEADNPGTCRTVKCDLKDGSCKVELNQHTCSMFDTECVKWECAPEGQTGDGFNPETGCRLKRNITQECIDMDNGCWKYTCDVTNGTCVREDTCKSQNTACMTYACSASAECVGTEVPPPASNTSCVEYKCDDTSGWYVSLDKTPEYCRNQASDKNCKIFRCDPKSEKGCTYDQVEECDELCTEEKTLECLNEGHSQSTVEECKLLVCRVHEVEGVSTPYCPLYSSVNCFDESQSPAAVDARQRNEANPDVCFTVDCDHGGCIVVQIPKPTDDDKRDTACRKNVCEFTEGVGWNWAQYDTTEKTDCVTDECFYRECDPEAGCVSTDICRNRTTQCVTFTCENKKCVSEDVKLKETECTFEECVNDIIVTRSKDVNEACTEHNMCEEALCSELGECVYQNKTHGSDPCFIYECNPEVGWVPRPKCDDGLFCTSDTCTINGECRHANVDCYLELNMSEYPCFRAVCKEGEKEYKCARKKMEGVYIDLCGNCVREDGTEGSSGESLVGEDDCTVPEDEFIPKEQLAAATIAMIVLGAIIIGAAIASSTAIGTKALLDRARAANNQSAHSNPLFEGDQTEMNNPAFAGEEA